jgi:PEP-CTERM motif
MKLCSVPSFAGAAMAGALAIVGSLATLGGAQAALVDLTYNLELNGMSSGTCPGGVCGTVSVVGDTTSSLTYTVDLATGVSFHGNHTGDSGTGPVFYFDLTDSNPITFSGVGVDGTIGTKSYSYNTPASGTFAPNPGNFPGPYNYEETCTNDTAGKICNGPLTFIASGATASDPFVIGSPLGGGAFSSDNVAFVADLSISGSCGDKTCTAGTGDVGSMLASTVPEPATWAMMLIGFAALGYAGYRKASAGRAAVASA